MSEPNDRLSEARKRVDSPNVPGEHVSRQELADLVNAWIQDHCGRTAYLTANYVGKMERGELRWPGRDYRAGLRAVLSVNTDGELGFHRSRRSRTTVDDVDRKQFITAALGVGAGTAIGQPLIDLLTPTEPTPVPSIVGQQDIDEVSAAVRMFNTWENAQGGGIVREAIAAQLRYSAKLLDARCHDHLRADLYTEVSRLGHTAGFVAFDAGAHEDARRMFRFALACAENVNSWQTRANTLSSMARQAHWLGDFDAGLTCVESAMVRSDHLPSITRAMLHALRARTLAELGRTEEALAAVRVADEEFHNATPADTPPGMHWYSAAEHDEHAGQALTVLAMRGRFLGEASNRLTTAIAGFGDYHVRSRALCQVRLATLTMAVGDPREAATIGTEAVMAADSIRSNRLADDLRTLHQAAKTRLRISEVSELRQRIGAVVAQCHLA